MPDSSENTSSDVLEPEHPLGPVVLRCRPKSMLFWLLEPQSPIIGIPLLVLVYGIWLWFFVKVFSILFGRIANEGFRPEFGIGLFMYFLIGALPAFMMYLKWNHKYDFLTIHRDGFAFWMNEFGHREIKFQDLTELRIGRELGTSEKMLLMFMAAGGKHGARSYAHMLKNEVTLKLVDGRHCRVKHLLSRFDENEIAEFFRYMASNHPEIVITQD